MVRPRSCRVIYYFNTPALGIRHQSFDRVNYFWVNRAVSADKSMHKLWNQFQWWFMSLQRLSFPWLFLSQQGLCALTNPYVTCGSFSDYFLGGNDLVFINYFWVNKGCVR
jgi:hypothetical protein